MIPGTLLILKINSSIHNTINSSFSRKINNNFKYNTEIIKMKSEDII